MESSRPMRARGLKHRNSATWENPFGSRPMRARGLKRCKVLKMQIRILVAPHAGAWIETFNRRLGNWTEEVAPHAGAWIETSSSVCADVGEKGRAPCGRVD